MVTETKELKKESYTIKNLKTFKGREGMGGFNTSLYRDGDKIATVVNDDSGGETYFDFTSNTERELLQILCKSLPPQAPDEYFPDGLAVDMDMFIHILVGEYEQEKYYRRKCKTYVLWKLTTDEPDAYRQVKASSEIQTRVIAKVRDKYGDDVKEIINERF